VKYARFEKDGKLGFGSVEGDTVRVMEGSLFDHHRLTDTTYALADLKILPPTTPTKIVCIAHNYRGLIEQIGEPFPKEPILFFKPPTCLIGHNDPVIIPNGTERVIFEGELAIVIKRQMKNVPMDKARDYVAGYTCFNDVTERAMIERDHFLLSLGKGMDTFGPCGPFLVDDIDPNHLSIATYLNGKAVQTDHTSHCIFTMEFLLSYISKYITLLPGDIVSTGTPQGVDTLVPGDLVEVEIERIGKLKNTIVSENK
jgi:2-keto-4-pentenoate hydratase/2-oxohepta-3-ene-1,7-dioic acid hydratase in catechol pathway